MEATFLNLTVFFGLDLHLVAALVEFSFSEEF
jgi:hypothetical protein